MRSPRSPLSGFPNNNHHRKSSGKGESGEDFGQIGGRHLCCPDCKTKARHPSEKGGKVAQARFPVPSSKLWVDRIEMVVVPHPPERIKKAPSSADQILSPQIGQFLGGGLRLLAAPPPTPPDISRTLD